MPEIRLAAELGRTPGTRSSRRLRRLGKIPAVVYGHGMEPMPVAVAGRELRRALTTEAGLNAVVTLELDGQSHLVLARQVQRHPTRHTVTHVDFLVVSGTDVISSDVPIVLVGEAKEIGSDAVVEHVLNSLAVQSRPGDIPNAIEVDISGLQLGEHITVDQLSLPPGVTTEVDPSEVVVTVKVAEVLAEEEAAPEDAAESGGGAAPPSEEA